MKEIKQMRETMESAPADRTDIVEECRFRLSVYEEFAPKLMSEDEIKTVIHGVLSDLGIDAPTAKDKGKIMKELMPKVKGKADNKMVNELVGALFQQKISDDRKLAHKIMDSFLLFHRKVRLMKEKMIRTKAHFV